MEKKNEFKFKWWHGPVFASGGVMFLFLCFVGGILGGEYLFFPEKLGLKATAPSVVNAEAPIAKANAPAAATTNKKETIAVLSPPNIVGLGDWTRIRYDLPGWWGSSHFWARYVTIDGRKAIQTIIGDDASFAFVPD